jgi:hypothetical protein
VSGTRSHIIDGLRISRRVARLGGQGRDWQMIFSFFYFIFLFAEFRAVWQSSTNISLATTNEGGQLVAFRYQQV